MPLWQPHTGRMSNHEYKPTFAFGVPCLQVRAAACVRFPVKSHLKIFWVVIVAAADRKNREILGS